MAEPLRLFVLAGEPSGDIIGADLVRRLRGRREIELHGVGGSELAAAGLRSFYPMDDLAVMGWSDVLRRLPLLLWRARQTADAIVRQRCDVAVLIDSQVFAKAVAARVRKLAPDLPLVLYVAPTVWAYRPERAAQLRPLFDELLAILPFEPRLVTELGGPPTSYVGHPALARYRMRESQPERGPLLLLPGSRRGELRRHMALMREAALALRQHQRIDGFVIPTLAGLADRLRVEVADWPVPVRVVSGAERAGAFAAAYAAFAVSGTVTLELALMGVPAAVTYVADRQQMKRLGGRGLRMALPNIVLGRDAMPEMQFLEGAPQPLTALLDLIDDPAAVARQRTDFAELRAVMEKGAPEAPLVDPAERVLAVAAQPRLLIGS